MDSPDTKRTETQVALQAVMQAADLCQQVQAELVTAGVLEKKDRSPVTVADFAAQAVVCHMLYEAFPTVPIVAEEDSQNLKQPERRQMLEQVTRFVQGVAPAASAEDVCDWIDLGGADVAPMFWTLDPIDGTAGFLRGQQYAIALALIEDGEVQLGFLVCPNLSSEIGQSAPGQGMVFFAELGKGAWAMSLPDGEFRRISVAELADMGDAVVVESVESGHANHAAHQTLTERLGISRPPLRIDSQAKYGVVARGDAAIYLRLPSGRSPDYRERIWDHAAGVLIVEEAGGRVTDAFGDDLDFNQGRTLKNNRGVVVSSGAIHNDLLDSLRAMDL